MNLTTGSISDLDNLNLLSQLDGQRQSILLCTGNCNCINHLRQSMTNHPTVNSSGQLPESSSTATTSTLNSSTVNTFTTTTIEDERPTGANRNLIVETNFTSFSNRPNLYSEAEYNDNPSLVIDDESNKEPTAVDQVDNYPPDYPSHYPPDYNLDSVTTNLQATNADLELARNGSVYQLNRSSTFNDLQSYLRNYLQNR